MGVTFRREVLEAQFSDSLGAIEIVSPLRRRALAGLIGSLTVALIALLCYCKLVVAVMKEGHLFAGSIAENISFFDEHATKQNIEDAAELASIHGGIVARSMGSMLSGGQRIALARALYRKPKLLLLDEATSSLDIQREGMVNEAIRALPMTRVIIAHRRETFGSADRILLLGTRHENHEIKDITAALKTEPISATPVMA